MSATSILGVIQHYQRSIEKCQTDETRLLHCISKLYKLPIKVEHLQETGIGKTVNSLRKFDGEIGTAAKTLVAKWKAMVAAEEEPMETSCHQDDEFKSNGKGTDSDDDDNDDHKDLKKNIEINSNNNKHHSETKNTQSLSKDRGHRGDVKQRDESVENSSSKSQHRSTSSTQIEVIKNKHENKSNFSSSSKDKNNTTDKHHRKHEKSAKFDNEPEKPKDSYHDCSDKKQDKQKNTTSSSHKTSKLHKEENSYPNETHHHNSKREKSSHSDEKESAHHKESVKHENRSSSSSKERSRNSQKNESHKHEKHKSSSKDDRAEKHEKHKSSSKDKDRDLEHDSEKKKHSSPAKHTSPSTKTTIDKASTSAEASSERKRKHNSDQDLNKAKSPKAKLPKQNKVVEETNEVEDDEEGIDSSMGANFADVLGMLNVPGKKLKKTSNTTKSPTAGASISSGNKTNSQSKDSPSSSSSKLNGMKPSTSSSLKKLDTKPDLLSSSTKLEPLDPSIAMELPTISTNYKPLPLSQNVLDVVFPSSSTSSIPTKPPVRTMTEFEAISQGISSKTQRTKIYSGVRSGQLLHAPTLFDLCIRVLQKNIDALEYTGGVPFEVLRPVLERASPQQLLVFEEYNPYLMEDCDILWQIHVQRHYRSHKRQELESWREMFLRCQEDQERRLNTLAESIKQSQKIISAPVRKTQMAFVDSMVKPPRNVQRKQEQFGTKSKLTATPAARVAALSSVTPNAAKTGDARLRVAASVRDNAQVANIVRPLKKAPLMAKTLQFMRGRHKR